MGVAWSYYNKFEPVINQYMPDSGEGDTLASQIVTAVNKLVYKWYNDGDVFDNTAYLEGWANDLSSYANWLYKYVPLTRTVLRAVYGCKNDDDYEELLRDLADMLLDSSYLGSMNVHPKEGSIYSEDGPFKFDEHYDDDEEEDLYW